MREWCITSRCSGGAARSTASLGPNGSARPPRSHAVRTAHADKGRRTCLVTTSSPRPQDQPTSPLHDAVRSSCHAFVRAREPGVRRAAYDVPPVALAPRWSAARPEGREEQLARLALGGWKQRLGRLGACTLPHPKPLHAATRPTAGVDAEGSREFWNEIHALPPEGLTVSSRTHYGERSAVTDRLYRYGHLLVHGTGQEVIAQSPPPHFLPPPEPRGERERL